jgi:hypothetical protein
MKLFFRGIFGDYHSSAAFSPKNGPLNKPFEVQNEPQISSEKNRNLLHQNRIFERRNRNLLREK